MRARGVLLVAWLVLAAACAGETSATSTTTSTTTAPTSSTEPAPDSSEPGTPPLTTSGFAISAHRTASEGGMAAIVTGIVEVDTALGCVWLSDPDGSRHPAVWPFGTTAFVNPFSIILPNGQIVEPGDRVEGGGGYVAANPTAGGFDPFPEECAQSGEMAVFNSTGEISVTPGVGLDVGDTLYTRFATPAAIGIELVAVNPNQRSVAVVDFVTGTVHLYGTDDYQGPPDAIDGASGGGGFIHLWANGTVYSYPGTVTADPIVYQPEPLRSTSSIAPSLRVIPGIDGEHTWLVQPPIDGGPTLVELVNLVEERVTRIGVFEIDGDWHGVGVTGSGLILENRDSNQAALVDTEGSLVRTASGRVLSVGPAGVVLVSSSGTVTITNPDLTGGATLRPPDGGEWTGIGDPPIPTNSPPLVTGGGSYLVLRATDGEAPSGGALVVVEQNSLIAPIASTEEMLPLATWSRAEDWIVFIEGSDVTLIPADGGQPTPLGDLVPADHWVLTAG